jgi:hypothetical protein
MPERARDRHRTRAATAALGIALTAVAFAQLGAAGCGGDEGSEASETATVVETVSETVTDTAGDEETTTGAAPPAAPSGPVVRFQGTGDRILAPVRVGRGGATLVWQNDDAVFSLFADYGMVVDSVERRGEASLRAGRRLLEVIASGAWRLEIRNARLAR